MQEGTTWRPSITVWMPNDSLSAEKPRAAGPAAGQETVCYAFVPRPPPPGDACGREGGGFHRLPAGRPPGGVCPAGGGAGRPRPVRRRRTLALTVDLAATGAVVVLLAAVVLRFFAG